MSDESEAEEFSVEAAVNTPAFGDAVMVAGIATILLWPLASAVSALKRWWVQSGARGEI